MRALFAVFLALMVCLAGTADARGIPGTASAGVQIGTTAGTARDAAAAITAEGAALKAANNLSDCSAPSTCRSNIGAAASGANTDITGLGGLTTALPASEGGCGTTSLVACFTALMGAGGTLPIANAPPLAGYIYHLYATNDAGTPNTKMDVSTGQATDSTGTVYMIVNSPLVINAGTVGANGLDAGSLTLNTWYYDYVIGSTSGGVAGLLSASLTPTLPSGYVYYRRVGAILTDGSAHFLAIKQDEETTWWQAPVQDSSVTLVANTGTLISLRVPPGIQVRPTCRYLMASSPALLMVSSPDEPAQIPTSGASAPGADTSIATVAVSRWLYTDTSQHVRLESSGTPVVGTTCEGWTDSRGRL